MYINLDYPVNPRPRYGYGKPPHPFIYEIINSRRAVFENYLGRFIQYKADLAHIALKEERGGSASPYWINGWFSGLDAIALYGFLCLEKPCKYLEIGSGMSTKFARRAVLNQGLNTCIISIDPNPRSEVDSICNKVIRKPVEEIDMGIFEELREGDILFVDNSHRVFMNSDVTVVFMDVLSVLRRGVLVHFHDIFLPFDYPPAWGNRFYSEQYLLAALLLSGGGMFDIILANAFISNDAALRAMSSPLWEGPTMNKVVMTGGVSFWLRKN